LRLGELATAGISTITALALIEPRMQSGASFTLSFAWEATSRRFALLFFRR
jgi:hypothetical protein